MNYKKLYELHIANCRNTIKEGVVHKHHIIPRSLDGGDNEENIIILTLREHYIAHLILAQLYPDQIFSVEALCLKNRLTLRRWIRRRITLRRAHNIREANRAKQHINNIKIARIVENHNRYIEEIFQKNNIMMINSFES